MKYSERVNELLDRHYGEVAGGGIVDKPPSKLLRGEGVQKDFYIMKIDLVRSTMMFKMKQRQTYLKFAHTFLSTIDRITQEFGADPAQMEYAGDGLLAYFADRAGIADAVLQGACYCRFAVKELSKLDRTFDGMKPLCRVVLHFAPLTVAKIGPRENSILTAIGQPIHHVAKLEEQVGGDVGRVTPEFYSKLQPTSKRFLTANVVDRQELITESPVSEANSMLIAALLSTKPPEPYSGFGAMASRLYPSSSTPTNMLSDLMGGPSISPPPQYRTVRDVTGYNINWQPLFNHLESLR